MALSWLFWMLLVASVIFVYGSNLYEAIIADALSDPTIPNYFKVGLRILPFIVFIGLFYTAYVRLKGGDRESVYR
jgi:hypothetical protein